MNVVGIHNVCTSLTKKPLWQNVCTSLTSLLSRGFLLKALLLPPFLGSPITAASFHFWPLVEIWRWIKFWPTTSTMSWLFFLIGWLDASLQFWPSEKQKVTPRCSRANWYLWPPPPVPTTGWLDGLVGRGTHGHIWGMCWPNTTWDTSGGES